MLFCCSLTITTYVNPYKTSVLFIDKVYSRPIAQDETPQNEMSHLVLCCLLSGILSKIKENSKITPAAPEKESRLNQMIRMGKSIRYIWVKEQLFDVKATIKRGNKQHTKTILDTVYTL